MNRDRVVQIIGEAFTAEVMSTAVNNIVAESDTAVDVEKIAMAAADRMVSEGLI